MSTRSALRSLFYVAKDLRNGFWPLQAARVVLDSDYERRMRVAAAAHDAVEGLNEFEAEHDGLLGPDEDHAEALRLNEKHDEYAESARVAAELGKRLADKAIEYGRRVGGEYVKAFRAQCIWCGNSDTPGHPCGRATSAVPDDAADAESPAVVSVPPSSPIAGDTPISPGAAGDPAGVDVPPPNSPPAGTPPHPSIWSHSGGPW